MKWIIKIALIIIPFYSWGQLNDSIQHVKTEDISLMGLTHFEISVASKTSEPLNDAPGVITAYKKKELRYLAYYTLRDLANITPGYSSYMSLGESTLETRGQKAPGFDNNKHLLYIDGIPVYHARAGKVSIEEDLPLLMANQVEFLRGPESALYGVGAFHGVINIETNTESDSNNSEARISYGPKVGSRQIMANAIMPHKTGTLVLNVGHYFKEASLNSLGKNNVNTHSVDRNNTQSNFLRLSHSIVKGKLRGLTFGVIGIHKTGGLGEYWMGYQNPTHEMAELKWGQYISYMKFERPIHKNILFHSYLKVNRSVEGGKTGNGVLAVDSILSSMYQSTVSDKEALAEIRFAPTMGKLNKSKVIIGTNIVSRRQLGAPNSYAFFTKIDTANFLIPDTLTFEKESDSYSIYSAYVQAQQRSDKFLEGTAITAGVRYDYVDIRSSDNKQMDQYAQTSPRLALVQGITKKWSVKLLYGRAFRAPLLKVRGLNLESLNKYPDKDSIKTDLRAEIITSCEAAVIYKLKDVNISIAAFRNITENSITKINIEDVGQVFDNDPNNVITLSGVETELIWSQPSSKINVRANWSFAISTPDSLVQGVPIHKANVILYYRPFKNRNMTVGIANRYVSNFRTGNVVIPGYFIQDMNVRYPLGEQFSVDVTVSNLLNQKYYYPYSGTGVGMGKEHVQGLSRTVVFSLNFDFK